jgi:hypothetical protein
MLGIQRRCERGRSNMLALILTLIWGGQMRPY